MLGLTSTSASDGRAVPAPTGGFFHLGVVSSYLGVTFVRSRVAFASVLYLCLATLLYRQLHLYREYKNVSSVLYSR